MKRKIYVYPKVVQNDIYSIKNLALDVTISNSTVDDVATKERRDADSNRKYEDAGWGNLW